MQQQKMVLPGNDRGNLDPSFPQPQAGNVAAHIGDWDVKLLQMIF